MRTIVDTGPLVALFNRRDQYHDWVLEILERLQLPFWTCEPVVTEASYLTGRGHELLEMVTKRQLRIALKIEDEASALGRLLARYAGVMDLADACVVRMSELTQNCQVLTTDRRGFSSYRRNGRDAIPLVMPER